MSLSREVARRFIERRRTPLPAAVALKTQLHIADSLAISLAAATSSALPRGLAEAFAAGAGTGACTVLGNGQKVAPASAAFLNASLAHILDFDDIHDAARLHPTTVTLPAALAAAELVDGRAEALVAAVALGNELMCRLGLMWKPTGTGPGSDWFLTQLFGYFGACLSAGLVLGASEDEIVSAFGVAYMQAAGGKEAGFGVDSNARSIYPAFAAMGGVHAILLARTGVRGPQSALDGDAGLFRIYLGAEPDRDALAILLDPEAWAFNDTQVKPWPSCRLSHPYVAAALDLRPRLPAAPIDRIVVAVNASAAKLCRPLDARRRPRTLQDAKYSIPFMTAFALAHGKVSLETLDERVLEDAQALALAARVDIDESLPDTPGNPPAVIDVHTREGQVRCAAPSSLDVSSGEARAKFVECLAYAGVGENAGALWDRLQRIEHDTVAEVLREIPRVTGNAPRSEAAFSR